MLTILMVLGLKFGKILAGCGWEILAGCGWLWVVVAGFRWFWLVVGRCGWFRLVPHFSMYAWESTNIKETKTSLNVNEVRATLNNHTHTSP